MISIPTILPFSTIRIKELAETAHLAVLSRVSSFSRCYPCAWALRWDDQMLFLKIRITRNRLMPKGPVGGLVAGPKVKVMA